MGENQEVNKKELLEKLRKAKDAKGFSYQDIANITEDNGEPISLSTIKRMFQKEADLSEFRYHQTVRPVVRAVLGMDEETEKPAKLPSVEQAEQYYATIEGLKAVVDFKNDRISSAEKEIDRLNSEIADLKADKKNEIRKIEEDAKRKVDYLKELVAGFQRSIGWHRRIIVWLGCVALAFVALLLIDAFIPGIGWIRY